MRDDLGMVKMNVVQLVKYANELYWTHVDFAPEDYPEEDLEDDWESLGLWCQFMYKNIDKNWEMGLVRDPDNPDEVMSYALSGDDREVIENIKSFARSVCIEEIKDDTPMVVDLSDVIHDPMFAISIIQQDDED